ncbi:hypothetical protein [Legionella bononiensis]|uniref:hypothetical protein n=1 Tax=Legionella bononiensis TaxID=2793102 RepID=UPI00193290B6|nr:hypothetical protein [Legionella bononiensis]MBL7562920.1 hypothetical protein [Legionella bononiensis]
MVSKKASVATALNENSRQLLRLLAFSVTYYPGLYSADPFSLFKGEGLGMRVTVQPREAGTD